MNAVLFKFYRCPRCRFNESTKNEIKSCNQCDKKKQLRNGLMCGGCSKRTSMCGICGDTIYEGNAYINFYRSEQEKEIKSAQEFFSPDELDKYFEIINNKFENFINEIKDKTSEQMLEWCQIRYYSNINFT